MKIVRIASLFLFPLLPISCASPVNNIEKTEPQHVVMVIDENLDPNHEVLEGKILASYTLKCKPKKNAMSEGALKGPINEEALLAHFEKLAKESNPSGCEIIDGITPHYTQEQLNFIPLRDRWNEAVKKRDFSQISHVEYLATTSQIIGSSHGMLSVGTIAYKNPHVKFVLVSVAKNEEEANTDDSSIADICPILEAIQAAAELYKKQSIIEAATKIPNDLLIRLKDIAELHHVTLVNKSYGGDPFKIQDTLFSQICGKKSEFTALSNLDRSQADLNRIRNEAQNLTPDSMPFLTLRSAGNESHDIGSFYDYPDCFRNSQRHLLVGSYSLDKRVSRFSNYGDCVDLYNLGTNVITTAPLGFLGIVDGTSFSSPLTVRYITENFDASDPDAKIKKMLMKRRDTKKFLPFPSNLEEVAYDKPPRGLRAGFGWVGNFDSISIPRRIRIKFPHIGNPFFGYHNNL